MTARDDAIARSTERDMRQDNAKALQNPARPEELIVYEYGERLEGWIAGPPVEVRQ